MDKHGDVNRIDQDTESIYIDYCKLDIEGCKTVYHYLVEQLDRRKGSYKKETSEMDKNTLKSFIDDIRRNYNECYIAVKGRYIPVRIDTIHGKHDEPPTFEGIIRDPSYYYKSESLPKVSYREFFNRSGSNTSKSVLPKIKDVIFNPPATIIMWEDNTKTVVKCQNGYEFDPWTGLTTAIAKKALGNEGNYCNMLNELVAKYEAKNPEEKPND